jgi:hypothetical protein
MDTTRRIQSVNFDQIRKIKLEQTSEIKELEIVAKTANNV